MNPDTLTVPGAEPPEEREYSKYEERFIEQRTEKDLRSQARMPARAAGDPTKDVDPRLAYELALEMGGDEELFAKYGLTVDDGAALVARPEFALKVKQYREEIVAGGVSFKLKAKIQAEALLADAYDLATDSEMPASVRADLIKWTAAVAGLGPDPKKGDGGATAGAEFTLKITLSGPGPQLAAPAIDVTPTSKEIS